MSTCPARLSGSWVGFTFNLIGGGGSILATPPLFSVVGISRPQLAIGTRALAVSANAFLTRMGDARAGNVRWRCALVFAAGGLVGGFLGMALATRLAAYESALNTAFASVICVVAGCMIYRNAGNWTAAS